jgi:Domain of unknown function (DUF1835)
MLHVTNGDSAGESLGQSGLPGEVLTWRDVLHDGPVPANLSPDELRAVRARFIADMGWGNYEDTLAGFTARDATLADYAAHDEVVLWFEHDLYDQLQLLQILDFFAGRDLGDTRLSLVCIDSYPQVMPFYGLGQLTPEQLATLYPARQQVTNEQLQLASSTWQAFRAPNPQALETLLASKTSALPFLHDVLLRHLEEFPSVEDGLSRTEREILEFVDSSEFEDSIDPDKHQPDFLFRSWMRHEQAPFMGDTSFFGHVHDLSREPTPLLKVIGSADGVFRLTTDGIDLASFLAQELELTPTGHAVLAGDADWVHLAGIDRWLGGMHLHGPDAQWRWSRKDGRLVPLAD